MYLYYFNTDHGRSDKILVSEIIKLGFQRYHNVRIVHVAEDSEIGTTRTACGYRTSVATHVEEGKIYRRTFWLNEFDMDRAKKIVSDYTTRKREELLRRLQNMEES